MAESGSAAKAERGSAPATIAAGGRYRDLFTLQADACVRDGSATS